MQLSWIKKVFYGFQTRSSNVQACYKLKMWLGLGMLVLSTCKIWPDFESLKCNNFLSVIRLVSTMSSIIYAEIHEEFNKTSRFWIAHTEQEMGPIIWANVFVDKTCFPRPGHKCFSLANSLPSGEDISGI